MNHQHAQRPCLLHRYRGHDHALSLTRTDTTIKSTFFYSEDVSQYEKTEVTNVYPLHVGIKTEVIVSYFLITSTLSPQPPAGQNTTVNRLNLKLFRKKSKQKQSSYSRTCPLETQPHYSSTDCILFTSYSSCISITQNPSCHGCYFPIFSC